MILFWSTERGFSVQNGLLIYIIIVRVFTDNLALDLPLDKATIASLCLGFTDSFLQFFMGFFHLYN